MISVRLNYKKDATQQEKYAKHVQIYTKFTTAEKCKMTTKRHKLATKR